MSEAMQRLLERLQTGWAPKTDEIDPEIQQIDFLNWTMFQSLPEQTIIIVGKDSADALLLSGYVFWIDERFEWAVGEAGFMWLYDDAESDKVRYLGG
jgi:hypothetical protein